jgi:hypothetical protein
MATGTHASAGAGTAVVVADGMLGAAGPKQDPASNSIEFLSAANTYLVKAGLWPAVAML